MPWACSANCPGRFLTKTVDGRLAKTENRGGWAMRNLAFVCASPLLGFASPESRRDRCPCSVNRVAAGASPVDGWPYAA